MSTDSGNLVPNPQSITSDCAFTLKNSAVRCRKYRASIPASNGNVFAPLSTVIVNIPAGRRATFLDCQNTYIRYTVKNNDATAGALKDMATDNNGACFINRLDLYAGSSQLETVQQYNMIYTHYLDFSYTESAKKGLSTMYGSDPAGLRSGAVIAGGGAQRTFTMPILSGTIGVGSDKYLPLGMLASDVRCEFTLEANNVAVTAALLSANWSITSFEVICSIIELSDEGYAQVLSISPPSSPIYLHGISWRNYVSNIPAATTALSVLIPARFASLKTLFFHFRPQTNVNDITFFSLSARSNPQIAAWNLRISGGLLPAKQCILEGNSTGGYSEGAVMIQESFHSLGSPDLAPGLNATFYNVRDAAALALTPVIAMVNAATAQAAGPPFTVSTGGQSGFALAIELETFSNKSDVIISGINTLADNVYFEYTAIGNTNVATVMNSFAVYDQILVLQNGILTARY
jgi:hypothetical protein